ncbi:hypothetical protein ES332_D08G263400v1 [Gossypium tomentosum]|uniref:Rrp5 OB-fold domain-containing protein n=1 Tax=Gossypium tomentosum TaxID=34277 RepID=A0A5D2JYW6_GOSTO|nr:hypothetical protein ES332_D08G263400v1 [Gossypium tomentosum]
MKNDIRLAANSQKLRKVLLAGSFTFLATHERPYLLSAASSAGSLFCPLLFHQHQVVGKALPTENDEHPKIYRMKLWAINEVRAKSKFWYFLRKLKKVKKSNGQVLAINECLKLCCATHLLLVYVSDYNTQKLPQKQFVNGQRVIATVMVLPSPETSGRSLRHPVQNGPKRSLVIMWDHWL